MAELLVQRLARVDHARMPDPEVSECPVRRRFSAEYKLRIVEEAAAASGPCLGMLYSRKRPART